MLLWNDPFDMFFAPVRRQAAFVPAADLMVSEGDLVLTMDLPGLTAEDLEIEVLDGYLVVRGERRRPEIGQGVSVAHAERSFGGFERRIKVPEGVDPDRITASMDHGVLSLLVPKPERLKPRTIQITTGEEQHQLETTSA